MAAGPDLDRLSDHRRDTESVRRAARKAFRAVPKPDDKRRRGGREGVCDVDLTVADAEQVVSVQRAECLMDGGGGALGEDRGNVLDRDWSAPIEEGPKDLLEHLRLPAGAPRFPPGFQVQVHELVSGLDRQSRHSGTSSRLSRLLP